MKDYVIVTALEQEFPFKEEFNILYTGAGKINASISLLSYLYDNPTIKNVINVQSITTSCSRFQNLVGV